MEDDKEEFTNEQNLRDSIMDDKNKNTSKFNKKKVIIISIISICAIAVIFGIILFLSLKDEDTTDMEQEFSVTIEVFKDIKNQGEKEHEKPNLNESVYFLSEDFNCNENDFQVFLDGKEKKFSKNFTFDKEGNYTVTYKLKKNFESLENLFRNCYYITKVNLKKIIGDNLIDVSKMF